MTDRITICLFCEAGRGMLCQVNCHQKGWFTQFTHPGIDLSMHHLEGRIGGRPTAVSGQAGGTYQGIACARETGTQPWNWRAGGGRAIERRTRGDCMNSRMDPSVVGARTTPWA